jgi:hypothetical protein
MSSPGQIPDIFEDFKNLKAFNFKTNPNSPKVLKSIVNLPNLELIIPQSNLDYSFLEDYGYQQTKSGNYIK